MGSRALMGRRTARGGRRARRLPGAGAVVLVAVLILIDGAGAIRWRQPGPASGDRRGEAALPAVPEIAPVVAAAYENAAVKVAGIVPGCAVRAQVLAGIGSVESGHATFGGAAPDDAGDVAPAIIGIALDGSRGTAAIADTDNGDLDGDTVWDRAVGPMQFIPTSWQAYGQDGNGDGARDPHNIYDAALGAAVHLCRAAPADLDNDPGALRDAIYAYNRSDRYVSAVLAETARYDTATAAGFPTGGTSADEVLDHPGLTVYADGRADLADNEIDPRAVSMLAYLAQRWDLTVTSLKTGHSQCAGGGSRRQRPDCYESHHWHGRGVDIGAVNQAPVSDANSAAREIVDLFAAWPADDPARPDEVGSPWPDHSGLAGFFTDADHEDHLHLAWCGPRTANGVPGDTCDKEAP